MPTFSYNILIPFSCIVLSVLTGQHAACRKYVLPSRGTQCRSYTGIVETLLEILNNYARRCLIWEIRNLMEADQVHTAFQSPQHPYQRIRMILRIIESRKHRIFETDTPLPREIILLYEVYHFLDRPRTLHRHHEPLRR